MIAAGEERSPIAETAIQSAPASPFGGAYRLPLLSLLLLPAVAPPEVHGAAMVGAAAIVTLAFALVVVARSVGRGSIFLVTGVVAGGSILAVAAYAPGAAWQPWSAAVLALAVAVTASAPGQADRSSYRQRVSVLLALSGTWVGARAFWERWFGLEAMAQRVREGPGIAWQEAILDRIEQGRAYAGLVTPAAAGIFLVMSVLATSALAISSKGRTRVVAVAAAAVQLAGLIATRSLTAAGALVAVTGLAFLFRARRRQMIRFGAGAAVALLVLVAAIVWRGEEAWSWGHPDSPWNLRAGNVRIAWAMAREAPWMGVGPGGYAESFATYRVAGDNESRHAHCLPAELFAEIGFPLGALASVGFLGFFLAGVRGAFRSGEPVRIGLALAGVAFAIHNLADFTAWLSSLLWAALIASRAARSRSGAEDARAGSVSGSFAAVLVTIAAIVASLSGLSRDARMEGLDAVAAGDLSEGGRALSRAVALAPWDPDSALAEASAALQRSVLDPGDPVARGAAREACDRAIRLSPVRASARALRARARLMEGDVPGAYADLDAAVRLHSVRADYRTDLGTVGSLLPEAGP